MPYLNVGCGNTRVDDHINMDITDNEMTDVDIVGSILEIPFDDEYFDGLIVSHVFEHLTNMEHQNAMSECWRVLKIGGKVKISCPDLIVTMQNFLKNKNGLNNYWYQAIFGGRRYPGDEHQSGFTKIMMADLLFIIGVTQNSLIILMSCMWTSPGLQSYFKNDIQTQELMLL